MSIKVVGLDTITTTDTKPSQGFARSQSYHGIAGGKDTLVSCSKCGEPVVRLTVYTPVPTAKTPSSPPHPMTKDGFAIERCL